MPKSDFKYIKDVFHKFCNSSFKYFYRLKRSSLFNFRIFFFILLLADNFSWTATETFLLPFYWIYSKCKTSGGSSIWSVSSTAGDKCYDRNMVKMINSSSHSKTENSHPWGTKLFGVWSFMISRDHLPLCYKSCKMDFHHLFLFRTHCHCHIKGVQTIKDIKEQPADTDQNSDWLLCKCNRADLKIAKDNHGLYKTWGIHLK